MTDKVEPAGDDGWEMPERRERAVMAEAAPVTKPAISKEPVKGLSSAVETPESNVRLPTGRGVLNAAEIEALLRPNLDDMPDDEPTEPTDISPRETREFSDSASASKMQTEEASRLAARLSLSFRRDCGLKAAARVSAVKSRPFAEALIDEGRGSAVACFTATDGEMAAMLVLSPALTAALIETACGGSPSPSPGPRRALTPLDAALLEGLVRPIGPALSPAFSFARIETDAMFAAALAPPGSANCIDLEVRVDAIELPARLIIADSDLFETADTKTADLSLFDAGESSSRIPAARAVTALLTVRIASLTVTLSRLSNLKAGSTLLLGVPADQPAEILSGGRDGPVIAEGDVGRRGGKMALRISRKAS